ncbi:hypothetical protein [Actinomadura rayongensis]|uniref:hypothetical protein n=1 Tax=Actinomadura rayongensis TaxID=1429076 RepID=UPI001929468C
MLKRLLVTGLIGAAGLTALTAGPAQADDPKTNSLVNVQFCRDLDVAALGAVLKNLLSVVDEHGDCYNGSAVTNQHSQINVHRDGDKYEHGKPHKPHDPHGLPNTR